MTINDETAERIVEKAEYIRDCLEILAQEQSLTKEAYLADRQTQDVVERRFETAIQACIDIVSRILIAKDEPVPEVHAVSGFQSRAMKSLKCISNPIIFLWFPVMHQLGIVESLRR